MKTEKMSVNLSTVEMGQIDYLVDKGLYDSRSDFVRSAVRKAIERHDDDVDAFIKAPPSAFLSLNTKTDKKVERLFALGAMILKKRTVLGLIASGQKVRIRVIGMYTFEKSITADEVMQVIESCKVYGKIVASDEVKEALKELEEDTLT